MNTLYCRTDMTKHPVRLKERVNPGTPNSWFKTIKKVLREMPWHIKRWITLQDVFGYEYLVLENRHNQTSCVRLKE